jgi:hypothetical protein
MLTERKGKSEKGKILEKCRRKRWLQIFFIIAKVKMT